MPTTSLGITYPCEADPITVGTWGTFANGVDSALTSSIALGETVRLPPYAWLENATALQTLTAGVAANATFDTEWMDRGGFWSPGSPTTVVLPNSGSYVVSYTLNLFNTINVQTLRMAIVAGGVEHSFHREQSGTIALVGSNMGLSTMLPAMTAGTVVQISLTYTGAATTNIRNELYIIQVANV